MRKQKRRLKKGGVFLLIAAVCLLTVAIVLAALVAGRKAPAHAAASSAPSNAVKVNAKAGVDLSALKYQLKTGGFLMLINKSHKLPESYTPSLVTIPAKYYVSSDKDRRFDKRAASYLTGLLDAGRTAGYNLVVYSGHRSYEYQQNNFNRHVRQYEAQGMSAAQAAKKTAELVAPPGTSEHESGLACDIVTTAYSAVMQQKGTGLVATDFDKRPEFKWLMQNCAKYGFILRYLKDKVEVTGYGYESWHFRFVGVDNAKKIMAAGLALEEYDAKIG
jgi:zinc D-Ala-D-Ala carboxypeptidase